MFFKTAKTQILAFSTTPSGVLHKSASAKKIASHFEEGNLNLDAVSIKEKLEMVASTYKISTNPKDYIYVAVRALTADVPNENNDAFSEEELLRFDASNGCQVYQTFNLKPHHVNHRSSDPTQARGVIIDSHYNTKNAEHFPEILIAVDRTKDKRLAEGIADKTITGFSMGASASFTVCSVCDHEASSPIEFCTHIRHHKGEMFDDKKAFEWCKGVEFQEESSVEDPADKSALTQEVILASKKDTLSLEIESDLLGINAKLNTIISEMRKGDSMAINKKAFSTANEDKPDMNPGEDVETKETDEIEEFIEKKKEDKEKSLSNSEYGVKPEEGGTLDVKSDVDLEAKDKVEDVKVPAKAPAKVAPKKEIEDKVPAKALSKLPVKPISKAPVKEDIEEPKPKVAPKAPIKEKGAEMNPYAKLIASRKTALDSKGKDIIVDYYGQFGKDLVKDVKKKKVISSDKVSADAKLFKNIDNKAGNPPKEWQIDRQKGNPPKEFKFAKLYQDIDVVTANDKSKILVVSKSKRPLYLIALEDSGSQRKASIDLLKCIAKIGLLTAMKEYKAMDVKALYPAVIGKPGLSEKAVDDFRGDAKTKPTDGVEEKGTSDLEKSNRGKVKEDGVHEDGIVDLRASKKSAGLEELLKEVDNLEQSGLTAADILKIVDEKLKKAKKASITDNAIRDMKGIDKIKSEAKSGISEDGASDMAGVKRTIKNDRVYAGGNDDMDIDRKNIVDLKAVSRLKISTKVIEARAKKEAEEQSATEIAEFRTAFRHRYVQALKLASKRMILNLIDNPLKASFADVLLTPSDELDYVGMGSDLGISLIEAAFAKGADDFVNALLKQADDFIEMPDDSFLSVNEDTNSLNLVMPIAPMQEQGMPDSLLTEPSIDSPEELVERAASSNPIFAPVESSSGRFDHLRGVFNNRLS